MEDFPVCVKFDSDEDAIRAIGLMIDKSYSGQRGGLYLVPRSVISRFRKAKVRFRMGKKAFTDFPKKKGRAA